MISTILFAAGARIDPSAFVGYRGAAPNDRRSGCGCSPAGPRVSPNMLDARSNNCAAVTSGRSRSHRVQTPEFATWGTPTFAYETVLANSPTLIAHPLKYSLRGPLRSTQRITFRP